MHASISSKTFEKNVQIPVPKDAWREKFTEQIKIAMSKLLQLKAAHSIELQKSKDTFEKIVFENL